MELANDRTIDSNQQRLRAPFFVMPRKRALRLEAILGRHPVLRLQPRPVSGRFLKRLVRPEIIGKQPVHDHLKCVNIFEAPQAPHRFEYRAHPRFLTQPTPAG